MAAKKKTDLKRGQRKASINPGLLVSDRVQIRDVRLMNCHCDQQPAAAASKKNYDIKTSTDIQIDKNRGIIVVITQFQLEACVEEANAGPVLTLAASFLLTYRIDRFDGLTREGFKQFANLNGVYNAWPYWREFVQNTVGRMALPPLTIPVFRIVEAPAGAKTGKNTKKKRKTKTS